MNKVSYFLVDLTFSQNIADFYDYQRLTDDTHYIDDSIVKYKRPRMTF